MANPNPKPLPGRGPGRPVGVKNKSTLAREELAKAQIAEAQAAARLASKTTGGSKFAIHEMQKALSIAESFASACQPKLDQGEDGKPKFTGGDPKAFGEWFDRYFKVLTVLAEYQAPKMRAVDAPTPPPDASEEQRKAKKRFGLKIFEGGRQIREPGAAADEGEEEV